MFLESITRNLWLAIGTWVLLYGLDYALTIIGARSYRAGANKHFSFPGGYELNPVFKEDVARLRIFSFRFLLIGALYSGLLFIIFSLDFPEGFQLVWGMLICLHLTVFVRHVRNLALFHYVSRSRGITGWVQIEHWLSLRISSIELVGWSMFFLFMYLLLGGYFLLGGAASCFFEALRTWRDSGQHLKAVSTQPREE